jgi:DNA-binding PadR family transcriptional regulator
MFGEMDPGMEWDWFDMPSRRGRSPGVRRGDVRDSILVALAQEPMHGYRIIKELSEQSEGRWRPSAGSIYPTLQQLEDEGLVTSAAGEGKRIFSLTEAGLAAAAAAGAKGGPKWRTEPDSVAESVGPQQDAASGGAGGRPGGAGGSPAEFRDSLYQLSAAVAQVAQIGSAETAAGTRAILMDARKSIYRLLAEEDEPGPK